MGLHLALSAILDGACDCDDLMVSSITRSTPAQPLSPRWAGHCLLVPIHLETAGITTLLLSCLPRVIGPCWCKQVDAVLVLTVDKLVRFRIRSLSEMLFGEERFSLQRLMDHRGDISLSVSSSTRFSMGNQSRMIFITTLCEMNCLSHPPGCAFSSIRRVSLRGGADHFCWRRTRVIGANVRVAFTLFDVLYPNTSSDFSCWDMTSPVQAG